MRIHELINRGQFPESFGNAELKITKRESPAREGSLIKLPNLALAEIFVIGNGIQFLYTPDDGEELWFGGQDEQPFLVRLHNDAFAAFVDGGEKAFYDALRPTATKRAEGVLEAATVRQGDMHLTPLPYTWKELTRIAFLHGGSELKVTQAKKTRLFGTRHHVNGKVLENAPLIGARHTIVSGEIVAPDHETLAVEAPHLVVQTALLWEPQNAD